MWGSTVGKIKMWQETNYIFDMRKGTLPLHKIIKDKFSGQDLEVS